MLNQNQSWNLSLEGAWNSTTVNEITENRTFNEVYEILTSNSNPLTHDRKGNLTQNKDSSQYTWDYNNQLSHSINASSESSSYTYDALGRRISKQVNGTLTVYINIGYQIATEYQSTDGINFNEKQSYVYATYIDDPLALIKASGERFYYHSNGQFSISKITDEYKNIVEAYAYNAYGDVQILQSYAGLDNPYYFTGRQLDQETGLFYFRARYYDAKLGQFISRDPIGYVDGMSLYRGYFAVNSLDPSGKINILSGEIKDNGDILVRVGFVISSKFTKKEAEILRDRIEKLNTHENFNVKVNKGKNTVKIIAEVVIADPKDQAQNKKGAFNDYNIINKEKKLVNDRVAEVDKLNGTGRSISLTEPAVIADPDSTFYTEEGLSRAMLHEIYHLIGVKHRERGSVNWRKGLMGNDGNVTKEEDMKDTSISDEEKKTVYNNLREKVKQYNNKKERKCP